MFVSLAARILKTGEFQGSHPNKSPDFQKYSAFSCTFDAVFQKPPHRSLSGGLWVLSDVEIPALIY